MQSRLHLLFALCLAASAWAQDPADLDLEHSVDSALISPHTTWARPYVRGRTRVLFFVNGHGTTPREVIELKERFDLDVQMAFWATIIDTPNQHWHGDDAGLRRIARLLAEKWDAFVFMGAELAKLPEDLQYTLVERVTNGAGLVIVGGHDARVLKDKNKLTVPAFLADVAGAEPYTVKQGRGLRLPAPAAMRYGPGWAAAYDEWDMRFGKAVLWAAGREPKLSLTVTAPLGEVDRANPPGPGAGLAWAGARGGETASLTLRRDDGIATGLASQVLKTPSGKLEVRLPLVRSGSYYLDVIVRDGNQVAAFGSVPLKLTDARQVTAVTLDRAWAEIGESLSGKVELSKPPAPPAEGVIVQVFDRRGREVYRSPKLGADGKFSVKVEPWWPMLARVQATLMDGAQQVSAAWQFANVVKRARGRFNFVMWDCPGGNLGPLGEESLRRSGITVHLGGGAPPLQVAAQDMAWIPYTTHIGKACDPCWADPAAAQKYVDDIVGKQAAARQHGVFVYSLGDEILVRGSCAQPADLAAYRQYLKSQYDDLEALNASWGTHYTGFEQVELSQPQDPRESEALRAGNFPRWYDRQAYESSNFCQLTERFGRAFRALDPQSKCGFEGAGTFTDGDDLDGFVRSNGWWSPYPGTADEVLRSIAPRDFPHSNWMGYTRDADTLLEKYWRMVTRGCDSVFWWRWDGIGRFHGWLMENLDPYPANRELLRDTQIVRDGLGDLLLRASIQTDRIGILYSQPSAYAARVQSSPSFGSYESAHASIHAALRDLGCNFRYFTDRQMRLGEVDLDRFKVILLPLTQAMSAQEAELFRDYVARGGTLIADVRPAIYDGHVKPLAAGQLDEVFGIRRAGFPEAVVADAQVGGLKLEKVRVDPGVQADSAKGAGAAGPTPLWLANQSGNGRAVLLNLAMSSYPSLGSETTPEPAAATFSALLTAAGVPPAVTLTNAAGRRARNVEITRWVDGPVEIVSIFRHAGSPEAAKLTLSRAMCAYDLKARRSLGRQKTIALKVTPYRARFYAFAPEPLGPMTLKAAPVVARGAVNHVTIASALADGEQAAKVT
ncbi:MAG: beta-galactosidase trimerization domain-containing protein, partial [Armatimonadetes bacterium]|nr:beta-galactosidase trimerization domain-containing protein [Armatimonadota bacterium]